MSVTLEQRTQLEHITYSRNYIHGYSRGVQKLFDLYTSYATDAEAAFRRGKNVVYSLGAIDAPLLYASDAIPVAITELGRLGSPESLTIAEDYFQLPPETCSMVKTTLGEWYLRKDGINRLLAFSLCCDPYNVSFELAKEIGFDVHYVDTIYLPPKFDQAKFDKLNAYLISELRKAAKWATGKDVDENKLAFEIKRRNRLVRKVRRIMELRVQHPLYIRSLPTMFLLTGSGNYYGKPDEFEEVLDLLLEELENAGPDTESSIPLVWYGVRGHEFGLYQSIDEAGGSVLGWLIPAQVSTDYNETLPPLEALSRYMLDARLAGPLISQIGLIEEQFQLTNSRGLIIYTELGCPMRGVGNEMYREHFQKKGIPCLSLEATYQVGPSTGQILTRVRAFLEMLS